jgi:hypothetical protein
LGLQLKTFKKQFTHLLVYEEFLFGWFWLFVVAFFVFVKKSQKRLQINAILVSNSSKSSNIFNRQREGNEIALYLQDSFWFCTFCTYCILTSTLFWAKPKVSQNYF